MFVGGLFLMGAEEEGRGSDVSSKKRRDLITEIYLQVSRMWDFLKEEGNLCWAFCGAIKDGKKKRHCLFKSRVLCCH